ncbi:MAG: hypothetical protein H0T46_35115 [Deltaproteobacteria bacterium]|nr:hypothetical protein [Deltaproteobacteria bacterium]
MKSALAIAAALVLGACKQASEPTPASEVLAKSRALAAQLCACKDKACATPLLADWNEMSKLLHGATFTEEQVEGLTTEDTRVERCMAALAK